MHRVSIASVHSLDFYLRQTPNGRGAWDANQFSINDPEGTTLFIIDEVPEHLVTCVHRDRRVFVVTEPSGMRSYGGDFLSQFGLVISPFSFNTGGVPLHITQTGLPWFYGIQFNGSGPEPVLSFEDLVSMRPKEKRPSVSVVCSTKSKLPRHRERLKFIAALQDHLGDRLIVRGRGFAPISDKAEAIDGSRYHLVLENSDLGCFWTEKLADAFLGWTLPLFAGPRAALNDFPDGSIIFIDLEDQGASVAKIERILEEDPYEHRLPIISAAREKVLREHKFFCPGEPDFRYTPSAWVNERTNCVEGQCEPGLVQALAPRPAFADVINIILLTGEIRMATFRERKRNLALQMGLFPEKLTTHSRLEALINQLRPRESGAALIRLGSGGDGGYLVPNDLEGISACLSPGVSTECGFDLDMAERGIDVYLADASVSGPPIRHERFQFTQRFIDAYEDEKNITFEEFAAPALTAHPNADWILQMDIEGAE